MSKTIIYVGGFRLPDQNSSALRVIGIARMLNRIGYQTLIGGLIVDDVQKYEDLEMWDYSSIDGVNIKRDKDISPIVAKVEEIGKDDIHCIIAYNYAPIAFYRLYRFCKIEKINLIPDITEWYLIDGKLTIQSALRRFMTDWRIAVISPRCKNMIVAVHYMAERFGNVHNLILPVISDGENHRIALNETNNRKIKFFYAGNPGKFFSKERVDWCIEILCELQRKYTHFEYHIVGLDKEQLIEYKASLKPLLEKHSTAVISHGRLPHGETMELFKQSTFLLFVRPENRVSRVGFPNKVKEAFDLGIPVITNDTGDLSRYIHSGENGFIIKEYSKEAVQKKLESILCMDGRNISSIREQCRKYNPFHPNRFMEATSKFLLNLQ